MQASREPILALAAVIPELNKIEASIPYDFEAKNLTAYGDVLPVAALLEKPGLPQVVEETITAVRAARADADQAAHVELRTVTLDTDTTVHTLFGQQMGGPKSYNPKNGERRATGRSSPFWRKHASTSEASCATAIIPAGSGSRGDWKAYSPLCRVAVETIQARADSAFYCGKRSRRRPPRRRQFIISAAQDLTPDG